eukprot:8599954-Pyramimonas_sp.AAC.1
MPFLAALVVRHTRVVVQRPEKAGTKLANMSSICRSFRVADLAGIVHEDLNIAAHGFDLVRLPLHGRWLYKRSRNEQQTMFDHGCKVWDRHWRIQGLLPLPDLLKRQTAVLRPTVRVDAEHSE